MSIKSFRDSYSLFKVLVIVLYEHEIPHPAVTYTPELIPGPVNNTLLPIFSSCPSETLYSTYPPITTSYKDQPIPPLHPKNPEPLPALDLKNKSGGGKGPLGRPDFCSKDPEHVTHLQMMW
jgi:hypothetical protein